MILNKIQKINKILKNNYKLQQFTTTTTQSIINKNNIIKNEETTTITTSINVINEFSFKVEKEVKQGDLLASKRDEKSMILSIKAYENGLRLTKDRIERALIHLRIAIIKYKLGLITECDELLNLSMNLLSVQPNGVMTTNSSKKEIAKIYTIKSIMLEKEFNDCKDQTSDNAQNILERAINSWKLVIENDETLPDGYSGVGRCTLKLSEPNIPQCFNFADKSIMCDRNHSPSLLFASEMLIIQNKYSIAYILLSLFFKNYKNFYQSPTNIYKLKPKELADAYFNFGLASLNIKKHQFSVEQFTESILIVNNNIQQQQNHQNLKDQTNLTIINNILEKQKNEFENNFNYSNLINRNNLVDDNNNNNNDENKKTSMDDKINKINEKSSALIQESKNFNLNQCNILDLISNHYFRGKSLSILKRYNEAISDFNFVIQNQPNQIKAFKERAQCFKELGDLINFQKDLKVYNDHMNEIKNRRQNNFNNYLEKQKNRKRKNYLQNFSENYDQEMEEDEDDYDDDYDDDYNENNDYKEEEDDDDDDYDNRYRR
ncbi:hypothetical protein RB653_006207 [Dictyostelium firmibasis]|uniref:TPR repeat-containing protein n=1 Tax=Dictyostelium firmibasis TaxID=79012 RepID=A0AAN7UD23_9MYCE